MDASHVADAALASAAQRDGIVAPLDLFRALAMAEGVAGALLRDVGISVAAVPRGQQQRRVVDETFLCEMRLRAFRRSLGQHVRGFTTAHLLAELIEFGDVEVESELLRSTATPEALLATCDDIGRLHNEAFAEDEPDAVSNLMPAVDMILAKCAPAVRADAERIVHDALRAMVELTVRARGLGGDNVDPVVVREKQSALGIQMLVDLRQRLDLTMGESS